VCVFQSERGGLPRVRWLLLMRAKPHSPVPSDHSADCIARTHRARRTHRIPAVGQGGSGGVIRATKENLVRIEPLARESNPLAPLFPFHEDQFQAMYTATATGCLTWW